MIRALVLTALVACGPRSHEPKPLPQPADIATRLDTARAALAAADALIAAADHDGAYAAALRGIDALGMRYAARFVKDDTDVHLDIARMASDDGDVAGAATAATAVLRSRIELATPQPRQSAGDRRPPRRRSGPRPIGHAPALEESP